MENIIREIVKEAMPNKNIILADDLDLIDDLGFDSIAMVSLISGLEDKCGVSFEDDELDLRNFKNITVITDTVKKCHEKN